MVNFCTKHKGTIAVFLTLILVPTFIFSGVMIDGSRILASKNMISGAGDLAMNAALSNYNKKLNETYGLLAMANTAEEVESIIQDYFEISLNACGVSQEDFSKALVYLELTQGGFSASDVVNTEIYRTEVLKQEILEYMKYRAPVTLIGRAMEGKTKELEGMSEEREAAKAEVEFEKELNDIQTLFDELKELVEKQEGYVNHIGSEQDLNRLLSNTESNYGNITLLAVAHYRLEHCKEKESGEMKDLMVRMADLSCNVNDVTADTVSSLIKMKRISNAMRGQNPSSLLKDLDKESDEYREMQQIISAYESAEANMEAGISGIEEKLDTLVWISYDGTNRQWKYASEGKQNCIDIKEKLKEIRAEVEKSRGKYENWKAAVNNMPPGSSKTAYQESLNEVSGLFENGGIIGDFEKKIDNNKIYFEEVEQALDQITFMEYRVDYDISGKEKFIKKADYGQITESGEVSSAAADFMGKYYTLSEMGLSLEINKEVDTRDPFVDKLKNEYCNTSNADEAKAKEETEKWDNTLKGKKHTLADIFTTRDIPAVNVRNMAGNDIPSVWLTLPPEADYGGSSIKMEGGLEDEEARKKAAECGSSNLGEDAAVLEDMSSLNSKLAGFAMGALEPLYYTEYIMGMFSYYTVNRNTEGREIADPQSISRASLKENAIYRAEVEYILWGSPNVRSNINKTKAILFASNFVFNMSFALTNRTLKGQARLITAFFPVGPLAKTAIRCALLTMVATIETVDNMLDLLDGKAVPLIKREEKWKTWLIWRPKPYKKDNSGFTYADYLWIMVCIKMYIPSQRTKLLGRTADCIELNMTNKKTNNDNSLKHMYTMIAVDASVLVDTFFLQKLGDAGYDVSYNRNVFKVNYHGIQGY